jgi:hypothetical protein
MRSYTTPVGLSRQSDLTILQKLVLPLCSPEATMAATPRCKCAGLADGVGAEARLRLEGHVAHFEMENYRRHGQRFQIASSKC